MSNPLVTAADLYGPEAPSLDHIPLSAPSVDYTIPGTGARAYHVLTTGVVSVRTLKGVDRTYSAVAGMAVATAISHVLSATTADLLLITD